MSGRLTSTTRLRPIAGVTNFLSRRRYSLAVEGFRLALMCWRKNRSTSSSILGASSPAALSAAGSLPLAIKPSSLSFLAG